jgi:type IV secretion system protein VirB1
MVVDVSYYVNHCAVHVAPSTMIAIIKAESNSKPFAVNLNHAKILKQPKNKKQAIKWVEYLDKHGYNFDVGLAQVNIKNIHQYGYKATDALDPCINIKVASNILYEDYLLARKGTHSKQDALAEAISMYNTGNRSDGFYNGYVDRVYKVARF